MGVLSQSKSSLFHSSMTQRKNGHLKVSFLQLALDDINLER